jgi:hypothetical protein
MPFHPAALLPYPASGRLRQMALRTTLIDGTPSSSYQSYRHIDEKHKVPPGKIFEGGPGQVLDLSAKGAKKVGYLRLSAAFWGVKMAH